ncbi:RnfABCDGE type electron transport complex subunit B [Legionella worsleiensis]|uniref:Electron transport complex protein n=1 Tax=Legionella worsleiensis TaxID=45076 RepID=A0A0W1AEM4_9GAMM|nr:RnfABCDGE type electron transport complex subunit B [Legionella worsleiensis]KTD79798.1 electron transport complex protein [Legionella worsleiensis]STY32309.1 electron transport complex protein [Legionella worsleiensis]
MATVKEVDALLPQTQCGECHFSGCMPYAEALVQGTALINQCPPGGVETVKALGALLHVDPVPYLDEALKRTRQPSVAVIREAECIGCTKCIKACPVDAIIGSGKLMHAVITHECTGCGLCVEPCPVDCIEMVTLEQAQYNKDRARQRYHAREARLLREEHEKQQLYREKSQLAQQSQDLLDDKKAKQNYIQQALARVQAKKR